MKKTLTVNRAIDFVTAVSGVFITPGNPSGLTYRERQVVAALLDILDGGTINPRIQKEQWKKFKKTVNLRTHSMSNMMRVLRQKKVVNFENNAYSLHFILRQGEALNIVYDKPSK